MPHSPRKIWTLLAGAVSVTAISSGAILSGAMSSALAADQVVRQFTSGAGQNAVGVLDASEDTEISGPQALTTGEDGNLYLLDQVNNRILSFDPRNPDADPAVLAFPDELQPTDLVVRKSDILVWDGSIRTLQTTDTTNNTPSYRGLEEVSTRAADDQFAVSAFAQMGSQDPGSVSEVLDPNTRAVVSKQGRARARQYVASRGAGSVIADVIPENGESGVRIEVHRQGEMEGPAMAQLRLRVKDRLGAVEFLEVDHQGHFFIFGENIPNAAGGAAAFVARFTSAGALEGIYELPLANVPLSRRFVTVSGDGDVYFLRTQRSGVEVLGVGFRPMQNGRVIDIRTSVAAASAPPPRPTLSGVTTAVRPLSRQSVIETAFAFEGIQWLVNPGAYGRDPDQACTGFAGRIRRPTYMHGKLNQQVRGIPYCWGCYGSLDQIRTKIERGVLAGNICTHNDPRSDVTGVDCSAFVSATWGLSHQYTTAAIPAIASPVRPEDLRPGDALNKPGSHVMLFLRFTPDRKAEVMESSPGACNGKVCRNVYPLASLLARGYQPVRYKALANDTSQVAQAQEKPEKAERPQKSEPERRSRRRDR